MGWHSFTKSLGKGVKAVLDPVGTFDSLSHIGDYAKDFKDWFDGTDAMKKQAQLQDEYNMKYWEMQNAYNTPSAQMQRFIDAGLNPNLAYSLSNTAGDVGRVSVSAPDSGSAQINKVIGAISAWQGIKNMRLQNENLAYQGDFTREQARRTKIDNDWLEAHGLSSFSDVWARRGAGALDLSDRLFSFYDVPAGRAQRVLDLLNPSAAFGMQFGKRVGKVLWNRGDRGR